MLVQMGVKIEGMGSDQLIIQGARHLRGVTMRVMGDRIVTGTYLVAAAATGGHVSLTNVSPLDNGALFTALEQMGCRLVIHERQQRVELQAPETLRPARDLYGAASGIRNRFAGDYHGGHDAGRRREPNGRNNF